jgi:hypothetical protein
MQPKSLILYIYLGHCILTIVFYPSQLQQKDKAGSNLLQKAKKSLASSFESFRSKRVSLDKGYAYINQTLTSLWILNDGFLN